MAVSVSHPSILVATRTSHKDTATRRAIAILNPEHPITRILTLIPTGRAEHLITILGYPLIPLPPSATLMTCPHYPGCPNKGLAPFLTSTRVHKDTLCRPATVQRSATHNGSGRRVVGLAGGFQIRIGHWLLFQPAAQVLIPRRRLTGPTHLGRGLQDPRPTQQAAHPLISRH